MKGLFILLLAVCHFNSIGGKEFPVYMPKSSVNPDWKTYAGTGYSIQYPPEWEMDLSGKMGASFFIFSPLESDTDQFRENINLFVQDLSAQKMNLDQYANLSEMQIKKMVTNVDFIENKRIIRGTDTCNNLLYKGDQGIFHLEFEQQYRIYDNKAYILTFTAEASKFQKYKEIGENILNSFAFKK